MTGSPLNYYIDGKLYVVGVFSHEKRVISENKILKCYLKNPSYFTAIYSYTEWIKQKTSDELCLTKSYFKIHENDLIYFFIFIFFALLIALITNLYLKSKSQQSSSGVKD